MKLKTFGRRTYEIAALAIAGACVPIYGFILGYINGKNDSEEEEAVKVGEEAVAEHLADILTDEKPEEDEQ